MESTFQNQAFVAARTSPKANSIFYWVSTAIFCLEMAFTAYYELLPQGAQAFIRLGFHSEAFRMELSLAKLVGVAALLIPMVPARLREWAYARLRHQPRLRGDRPSLYQRSARGAGPVHDHQRAVGALVLFLAPAADHASERLEVEEISGVLCEVAVSRKEKATGPKPRM